jgi:hypothetical protein
MSKLYSNINLFYSIDYKTEDNTYIFCGIESSKNNKLIISEFIKLKNTSWKLLFGLINKVKCLWRTKHFNDELTLDFQSISKDIFSKLKYCQENMNLRSKNIILENDINTEFQTLLFDFLFEEQELYEYYDELFDKKKYIPKNENIPFSSFITNYESLFINIYNEKKKIKRLKKLRWYLPFDEDNFLTFSPSMLFSFYNYEEKRINNNFNEPLNFFNNNFSLKDSNLSLYETDSYNEKEKDNIYKDFINNNESLNINNELKDYKEILINNDIINNLLDKEDNPLLYIVKLISITITLFCRETMLYLNIIYNENKNIELIKEYIKRFNNFVQASKYINKQCENINVVMNYLDKDILKKYPHFPKFSIYRLCVKIWFNEMSSILTEDNFSILTKIKNITIKLFSEYIFQDLTSLKINSFQSFLFNSGQSSNLFFKSKGDFSLSTSISLFNSNSNNQTISRTICPFGSFYEDSNIKYTIIEKCLSIIYETFSDEYSVYLFNLSNIDTNNYYEEIENNIICIIEDSIKKMFLSNINANENNKSMIKKIVDKILNYFKTYFFSQRIINKLKKRIFSTIIYILKNLIFEQIEIKITEISSDLNMKNNDKNNIIKVELNEKYINQLKNYLLKKNITTFDEIKNILNKIDNIEIIFEILFDLDKWLETEMQNFENIDKKVIKELDKNNISSSYNKLQRYLLSFSIKNNWETIRKIRTIENYHQKIINKSDNNINNSNILRQSINIFSVNNDLNNVNDFNSEDLNNFGNIDYFAEENSDYFMDINNNTNNVFSGINNLKNSNIFF